MHRFFKATLRRERPALQRARGQIGIVNAHGAAEGREQRKQLPTHGAQADEADGIAKERSLLAQALVPTASADGSVELRHAVRGRDHIAQYAFRHKARHHAVGAEHGDVPLVKGFAGDVRHRARGVGQQAQARRAVEHACVDLRRAPVGNHNIRILERFGQLLRGERPGEGVADDRAQGAELFQDGRGKVPLEGFTLRRRDQNVHG